MLLDPRALAYIYTQFFSGIGSLLGDFDTAQKAFTLVLVCACLALALRPGRGIRSAPGFCTCLFLFLFLLRLPTFLPVLFNPDEATLLAGGRALLHDPVFWRSLDGTTSGPLNYYALSFMGLLGFPLNFATARLLAILTFWVAMVFLYLTARRLLPEYAARLSVLPLFVVVAQFRFGEYLQYSSENVSIALIALAVWLLGRRWLDHAEKRREWFLIGAIVVLLPLAKLQAAPMAAALGLAGLAAAWRRRKGGPWRSAAWVCAGSASVLAAFLLYLSWFGLFNDFYQTYLRHNVGYANAPELGWTPAVFLSGYLFRLPDMSRYWCWISAFILLAAGYALRNKARRPSALGFLAVLLLTAAFYAVFRPGRAFWHYLLFLLVPLNLCATAALASALSRYPRPKLVAAAFALLTIVAPAVQSAVTPIQFPLQLPFRDFVALPRTLTTPVSTRLSELIAPGEPITLWGLDYEIYVLANAVPATRDAGDVFGPQRDYYVRRFLHDLQSRRPKLFIEAVGPNQRGLQNRNTEGYQAVPEIRNYIDANYDLLDDIESVRIFLQRGAPLPPPGKPLPVPVAIHCGGDEVRDGDVRWQADAFHYGGDPAAFSQSGGASTLSPLDLAQRSCLLTCEYALPLEDGVYHVRLHFIELVYSQPNARVFDVTIGNAPVFQDVDVFRESGGIGRPLVKETEVRVTGGRLVIGLFPKLREATINGIEITR